jgi:hypothetical protein
MKTQDLHEILNGMDVFDGVRTIETNPVTVATSTRLMPGVNKLTARDFRVCEICGGPAVQHPRFEMAQIVEGGKAILCCECLHESAFPAPIQRVSGELRIGDQIWECCECNLARAWGLSQPWDSTMKPVLRCAACQNPTRHKFAGVQRRG